MPIYHPIHLFYVSTGYMGITQSILLKPASISFRGLFIYLPWCLKRPLKAILGCTRGLLRAPLQPWETRHPAKGEYWQFLAGENSITLQQYCLMDWHDHFQSCRCPSTHHIVLCRPLKRQKSSECIPPILTIIIQNKFKECSFAQLSDYLMLNTGDTSSWNSHLQITHRFKNCKG